MGNEFVEAEAVLIGEGGNESLFAGLVGDKERINEH